MYEVKGLLYVFAVIAFILASPLIFKSNSRGSHDCQRYGSFADDC
jgi:hypothetical protein